MANAKFDRRQFVAIGTAAATAALAGNPGKSSAAGSPLLDKVTVAGFRVNAAKAGNVVGDFVEDIGTESVAAELEAALNANLAGIGRGPQQITLSVTVEFVSLAKTFMGDTHVKTTVSWSDGTRVVIGRLGAEPRGPRTGTAAGELRRLAAAYVARMKKLLNES